MTIHQRNLQILTKESFKTKNGLNAEIMKNMFNFLESAYHLWSNNRLERHNIKSVRYGTEKISHLGQIQNTKKLTHYPFSNKKFQIGKQMNVLVDYVKHMCNFWTLSNCIYLLIAPYISEIHKNRFKLFLYLLYVKFYFLNFSWTIFYVVL